MKDSKFDCILKSIFTFWDSPKVEECLEKARSFTDLSMVRIGKCEDLDIFLINGDVVKTEYFDDFVEGGNDAVYGKKSGEIKQFMPDNQIWLDANIDVNSIPYICFHELWERYQMVSHKLCYDDAHKKADAIEMKLRKIKAFETRRNILNFPRIEQPDENTCGHTCMAMVLQYHNIYKSVEEIKKLVPKEDNKDGLSPETMVKLATEFELKASIKENLSFEDIKSYIDKDTPITIELQSSINDESAGETLKIDWENEWNKGHYIVAIGYTLDHVIFANPNVAYKTYLSYNDLLPRWHNEGLPNKKTKKLAIIIEGEKHRAFEKERTISE